MSREMLDRILRLQDQILEVGLARSTLSSSTPKTVVDEHALSDDSLTAVFDKVVTASEIVAVSRDLFASGHYNIAVAEAFKAIDKFICVKSGEATLSGTRLMDNVFSPAKPKLFWTERATTSERDQQAGYHRLFSGAMLGIRNPATHEFDWLDDPDEALELLVFAQHLLKKAINAKAAE